MAPIDTSINHANKKFLLQLNGSMNMDKTFLNHLSLQDCVGCGSFGIVFGAENTDTGQLFAVKFIRNDSSLGEKGQLELERECRLSRQLSEHPNVVRVFDVVELAFTATELKVLLNPTLLQNEDQHDLRDQLRAVAKRHGTVNLVAIQMEMCGKTLHHWLMDDYHRTTMTNYQLHSVQFKILRDLSEGLKFLHSNKLMHRDIKPDNLMFSLPTSEYAFPLKVGDFGLCRRCPTESTKTSSLTAKVGSYDYRAPEVGRGEYGKQCDVYSFGLVVWEVVQLISRQSKKHMFDSLTSDRDYDLITDHEAFPGIKETIISMTMRSADARMKSLDEFELRHAVPLPPDLNGRKEGYTKEVSSESCSHSQLLGHTDEECLRLPICALCNTNGHDDESCLEKTHDVDSASDTLRFPALYQTYITMIHCAQMDDICDESEGDKCVVLDTSDGDISVTSPPTIAISATQPEAAIAKESELHHNSKRISGITLNPTNGKELNDCLGECKPGDTILLNPYTEYHGNFTFWTNNITLRGQRGSRIVGLGSNCVLHVSAERCSIVGVSFSGKNGSMLLHGSRTTLNNCDSDSIVMVLDGEQICITEFTCQGQSEIRLGGNRCRLAHVHLKDLHSGGITITGNDNRVSDVTVDGSKTDYAISMGGDRNRLENVQTVNCEMYVAQSFVSQNYSTASVYDSGLGCTGKDCYIKSCRFAAKGIFRNLIVASGNQACDVDFVKGVRVMYGDGGIHFNRCKADELVVQGNAKVDQTNCTFSKTRVEKSSFR